MNAPPAFGARAADGPQATSAPDEIFVALARQLQLPALDGSHGRVVGLTSSLPGEGVTTILCGLAAAVAERAERGILLIDANRARPRLSTSWGGELIPGWTEVSQGAVSLDNAVRTAPIRNTWRLPPGGGFPSATEAAELVAECRERFAATLVDLPPPGSGRDAGPLAAALDGIVLVVEAERVGRATVRRTAKLIERAGARVLGVVFNKQRTYMPEWLSARM